MKIFCPICKTRRVVEDLSKETVAQSRPIRVKCNHNGCQGWCSKDQEGK